MWGEGDDRKYLTVNDLPSFAPFHDFYFAPTFHLNVAKA
jgi:hypothetical protein